MRKTLSFTMAASLVLAGVPPVGAEMFGPNTVWGKAPQGASAATNAVLLDTGGKTVALVPILGGQFAFRDLPPGQYLVALQTVPGTEVARSLAVHLESGGEVEALFSQDTVPAAVVPGSTAPAAAAAASGGGGIGTTGWILIGAAAVGITAAIVIATNDDNNDNVASPSR